MSYTAQELNTRIQLQRSEGYQNELGEWIDGWVTYAECFAKVEPLVGNQYFGAGATGHEVKLKCTIRWRQDVERRHRVVIRGDEFEIEDAQDIKFRRREMLLYLKRIG